MPTRLLLKGPKLHELLAQVRTEHGAAAKVVSAERVRGAGLGGLFSANRYELTVEVPDPVADDLLSLIEQRESDSPDGPPGESAGGESTGGGPTGGAFAEVLAQLHAERAGASAATARQPAMPTPVSSVRDREMDDDATIEFVPGSVFESAYERNMPVPQPPRSSVPDRGHTGPPEPAGTTSEDAATTRTTTTRSAGTRVTNAKTTRTAAKSTRAATPEKAASATAKTNPPATPKTSRAATAKTNPPATPKTSRAATAKTNPPATPKTSRAATAKTSRPAARRTIPVAPIPLSARAVPEAAMPACEPDTATQHFAALLAYVPHATTRPSRAELARRLALLGVPDWLLAELVDDEAYPAIVSAFAAVPTAAAPSAMPGEIIAVAGEYADARAVAEDVCRLLRLDPNRIATAGGPPVVDPRATSSGDPDGRVNRLPGGEDPRVVVVDAPPKGHDGGWARAVLSALRPDTTWAVVDPSRKTVDTARHLAGLGRVDAIAVHGTARTADPASPLALNLPVALLDGRPATPYAWAGLLCERLYEGVDHAVR